MNFIFSIVLIFQALLSGPSVNITVLEDHRGLDFCAISYSYRDYTIYISSTTDDFVMFISFDRPNEIQSIFGFTNSAYVWSDGGYASYKPAVFTEEGIGIHIGNDFGMITGLFSEDTFHIELDYKDFVLEPKSFRKASNAFEKCTKELEVD